MKTPLCIASIVLFGMTPCLADQRPVDFSSCQRIPDDLNSRVLRTLLKSNAYTGERAFHGRYGGFGNRGGQPVDSVDALCRKHDILYATARAVPSLRLADRVFVAELKKLDPDTLTPGAHGFRRRAITFMSGKWARHFGKPPGTWFRRFEPGCDRPIDEQDLTRFFRSPVGQRETLLLVSMTGRGPGTRQAPVHRPTTSAAAKRTGVPAPARNHFANGGKL